MSEIMQTTQASTFRWECTADNARMVIKAFFALEVKNRGKQLVMTDRLKGIICRIADHMTNPKKQGIILMGGVGSGKSTMMAALQKAHNYLYPQHNDIGIIIRDAGQIVREYQENKPTIDYCGVEDMLAIDDLGKEPTEVLRYGTHIQPLVEIFEQRYNRMLPMLITTNLERKQVAEKYGRRIADRFNEMFEVIVFNGESYRKK